jgi:hypothetical protein
MIEHQLLIICWSDAAHHSPGEWCDPASIDCEVIVTTAGWLLEETARHLLLAHSYTTDGLATGVFSIPLANIISRHTTKMLDD